MKQTVHFSKTEHLTDEKWMATIAPAEIRKGTTLEKGDRISDKDFMGDVISISSKGNEVTMRCFNKFPCAGREYTIERK